MKPGTGGTRGAQLIVSGSAKGESMEYQCSLCGLIFRLADNRTAKESMAILWPAFKDQVRETHPEPATRLESE